jgi:hypothetical protein
VSHDYHEGQPGYSPEQILKDGCAECAARSASADRGINSLDPVTFARAWDRAIRWHRDGLPGVSDAEVPLLAVLAAVRAHALAGLLTERDCRDLIDGTA